MHFHLLNRKGPVEDRAFPLLSTRTGLSLADYAVGRTSSGYNYCSDKEIVNVNYPLTLAGRRVGGKMLTIYGSE
jgi:hypothetical protein